MKALDPSEQRVGKRRNHSRNKDIDKALDLAFVSSLTHFLIHAFLPSLTHLLVMLALSDTR